MHALAKADHLTRDPSVVASGARQPSIARMATIISATVILALLIGWIVAATLGLGVGGHPGVGPERPPAPLFERVA
jgi:pseudouridine-5'-phosphate glycosidase